MNKLCTYIFIFILSACCPLLSTLQAQQVTFQKTFGSSAGNECDEVQQTADGGYILTGITGGAVLLIKTDEYGDTLWTKAIAEFGTLRYAGYSVKQTADGGYIITGKAQITSQADNIILIKTDALGNTLWAKRYNGGFSSIGLFVQQTTDGGYAVAGEIGSDAGLIKTDPNGDTLWVKTYGGASNDYGSSTQQTTDGGYVIAGSTSSFGAGSSDVYLIKTDTNGNMLWSKTFGGTNREYGYSIQQTADGGYVIAGVTSSFGAGSSDVYLIKTDTNGNMLWSKTFGGSENDEAYYVKQANDGGFVIAGITYSFGASHITYLIKTDTNGNMLWSKTYGGSNSQYAFSVQQSSDGGYIVGASMGGNVYLIKTDLDGNSGCNEFNPATIQGSPPAVQGNPATTETSSFVNIFSATTSSPNYVIIETTICSTAGEEENTAIDDGFTIYPNPSNGVFILKNEKIKIKNVEIYNLLGEMILDLPVSQLTNQPINLSPHPDGIYFVRVNSEKENTTQKLIIQK